MSRKVRIAILVVLVLIAVVIATVAINGNNTASAKNEQPTPEVRIVYVTVTPAPKAENTKTPVTTTPTVVGASTKVEVTKAPVKELVSSSEISRKTIVTDIQGNLRQMMIRAEDLSKVDYEEVVIDVWNGVELLSNDKGIVGEIFNREDDAYMRLNAGQREEKVVKSFFDEAGRLYRVNAREGFATNGTAAGIYNLTNIKFVKLAGENNYRLVVVGKASNGGNSNPTAKPTNKPTEKPAPTQEPTQKPTQEPTQEPTEKPTPTPAPTLQPEDQEFNPRPEFNPHPAKDNKDSSDSEFNPHPNRDNGNSSNSENVEEIREYVPSAEEEANLDI